MISLAMHALFQKYAIRNNTLSCTHLKARYISV